MKYITDAMQVLPAKEISHLVKHYLFLESAAMSAGQVRQFADGHTSIVFLLGKQHCI